MQIQQYSQVVVVLNDASFPALAKQFDELVMKHMIPGARWNSQDQVRTDLVNL
jgi:hypothetical protein